MYLLDLDTTISIPTKWISLHMSPQGIITILFLQRAAGFRTTHSDYFLSDRCKHSTCKCLPWSGLQTLLLQSKFRCGNFSFFFYWHYFISSVFTHLCEHAWYFKFTSPDNFILSWKWNCTICYTWEVQQCDGRCTMLCHWDCRLYVLLWILADSVSGDSQRHCTKLFWLTRILYKTIFIYRNAQYL